MQLQGQGGFTPQTKSTCGGQRMMRTHYSSPASAKPLQLQARDLHSPFYNVKLAQRVESMTPGLTLVTSSAPQAWANTLISQRVYPKHKPLNRQDLWKHLNTMRTIQGGFRSFQTAPGCCQTSETELRRPSRLQAQTWKGMKSFGLGLEQWYLKLHGAKGLHWGIMKDSWMLQGPLMSIKGNSVESYRFIMLIFLFVCFYFTIYPHH